jgi:hypothetical protein
VIYEIGEFMPSKLSYYRHAVKKILIKEYEWSPARIDNFFNSTQGSEYLKAMWESACPASETAEFISEMKLED